MKTCEIWKGAHITDGLFLEGIMTVGTLLCVGFGCICSHEAYKRWPDIEGQNVEIRNRLNLNHYHDSESKKVCRVAGEYLKLICDWIMSVYLAMSSVELFALAFGSAVVPISLLGGYVALVSVQIAAMGLLTYGQP